MLRPDDYRGRIGAPSSNRQDIRDGKSFRSDIRFDSCNNSKLKNRDHFSPSHRDVYTRKEPSHHAESLKIYKKSLEKCPVQEYVIRDGQTYEYNNFYKFAIKLFESINTALSKNTNFNTFKVKKFNILFTAVSKDERKRLSGHFQSQQKISHCQIVIIGLPKSIFIGNGFGIGTDGSAINGAAKDLIEKVHRIGFVSELLYDVVQKEKKFDADRRLPDFSRTVDCFLKLEERLFNSRGSLRSEWPHDLLNAIDQTPSLFDRLCEMFKKIANEAYIGKKNVKDLSKEKKTEGDEDIESKIERQRQKLYRQEQAREMVEPLDDNSLCLSSSSQHLSWNSMAEPSSKLSSTSRQLMSVKSMLPPVGIVSPIMPANSRDCLKPVDMDIDEHPYRTYDPEKRRIEIESESIRRRKDEDERLKRKEEELEKRMKDEEEERRKREIEEIVRRRLDEEFARRAAYQGRSPKNYSSARTYFQPLHDYKMSLVSDRIVEETIDQDLDEIRRLVKETESRLLALTNQELDNGLSRNTLQTLAALGETASGMNTNQRRDLITELKNILGQSSTNNIQKISEWTSHTSDPQSSHQSMKKANKHFSLRRDNKHLRDRSRSRSPRNNTYERVREKKSRIILVDNDRRNCQIDKPRAHQSIESDHKIKKTHSEECAFCNSDFHCSSLCHIFTSPATRRLELKKSGRCQVCLIKHSGRCALRINCQYCGRFSSHHKSICEHPDHVKKLAALRELAKPT